MHKVITIYILLQCHGSVQKVCDIIFCVQEFSLVNKKDSVSVSYSALAFMCHLRFWSAMLLFTLFMEFIINLFAPKVD
jgi:hypothetical protein